MVDLNIDETENADLSELLKGLKRVDAPASFASGVMARIAEGETAKVPFWRGSWVPVYAASFSGLLIFALLFGWMGGYFSGSNDRSQVASTEPAQIGKPSRRSDQPQTEAPIASPPSVAGSSIPGQVAEADPGVQPVVKHNQNVLRSTSEGGSVDSALNGVDPENPRGLNPNAKRTEPVVSNRGTISVRDFLAAIGAEASFQGQEVKVSAVRAGSPADASGIKVGDLVESIGGTRVTPATPLGNGIKAMTVVRDGHSIAIKISVG
jgi:hypothetical protein